MLEFKGRLDVEGEEVNQLTSGVDLGLKQRMNLNSIDRIQTVPARHSSPGRPLSSPRLPSVLARPTFPPRGGRFERDRAVVGAPTRAVGFTIEHVRSNKK